MDLYLLMGWVLLCDIVMVLVVRWMTMRETDKARQEVIAKYEDALKQVSALSNDIKSIKFPEIPPYPVIPPYPKIEIPHIPTVEEIVKALPPVTVPEAELARIRESVTGALNGAVGSYVKKAGIAASEDEDLDIGSLIVKSVMSKLQK